MIGGDNKGVKSRHVQFGSITSLGLKCIVHFMASHRTFWLVINIMWDIYFKQVKQYILQMS